MSLLAKYRLSGMIVKRVVDSSKCFFNFKCKKIQILGLSKIPKNYSIIG